MASGVQNNPVQSALALGGVFGALTLAGRKLADAQLEHQKMYAKFNGTIAVAYAKLNRSDIIRSRASASATAGTTDTLVGAINEMRDANQPLSNMLTNIYNSIGTFATKIVTVVLYLPNRIAEALNFFGKGKPQLGPWQQTLNDLAQRHRDKHTPKKRPPKKKRAAP
jgi:hypothetical protein